MLDNDRVVYCRYGKDFIPSVTKQ